MTNRIPKSEWKKFFDDLSDRKSGWETTVEVLSHENGAEILAERSPLVKIKAEDFFGDFQIEIRFDDPIVYHSYIIERPERVYFHRQEINSSNLIEIEDEQGTKTLVQIIQPFQAQIVHFDQRFDLRTYEN